MLTVTEKAKSELAKIVTLRSLSPSQILRLTIPPKWTGEGDFGIVVDAPDSDDVVITYSGMGVLSIETEVAGQLARSMLDFKETPAGIGFALDVF